MSRFQVPNTPKGVSSTRPPPPPIVEDPIDCPPPRVCPRCIQTPCFECRPSIEIDCPPEAEMFTPRIRALPPKKDIPKVVDSRCPPQKPCPPCRKVECPQCPPPFVCRNKVETFTFQIPKPPRGVSECPPCPPPTVCPPRVRGVDCPPQFCPPVECPECPPPRVCRPCPPPKVCPPPVVCPECPPQIDRCTLVQVKLLSTEFLSFNVPNLKVSWLMFNYPSGQQITYRIQVSRTELFGPRDTVSYIISPLPPQNNTLGDMNFANIQINRADMLLTGLNTYIPTYTRLQIVVDNLVTYSNIVTVSRLRLNSLNFRYLYGSDSITGTVSANLSMSNQTYALNLPIYIETVNSLHVITSQQLANVVSASNNESISSIDIVAPINIQLTRRDDRYRVYFVTDQGTPEEKKFYSNYLSPQIVN